jgi:type I restriction enzyme S subunit
MYPGTHTPGGVPLIKVGDIKGGIISSAPDFCISEEVNHEYRRSQLVGDELLITLVGNPGECVVVTPEMAGWNPARAIAAMKLKDSEFRTYVKTVLESAAGRHLIDSVLNTTVQKTLNLKDIRRLPIPIPTREGIKNISEMAEAFSDRTALLRETNTTLEAIAQALFKSWFVDFDPVHAKMQGRAFEGMDQATAALFPDSFEETELGDVPSGWEFSTLGKSFELTMGQSPPGDTYNQSEDGLPFYQGRTDFGYCNAPTRLAEIGDALVSVRAPVGDVNMAIERCCIGRGVASVRHQSGCVGYTFYAMKNLGTHFKNFDTEGTIFGSINKKDFEGLPVVVPSQGVLVAFDEISKALDGSIEINERKIRALVEIRDTLLPRLISGQLRLPEAQHNVVAAL